MRRLGCVLAIVGAASLPAAPAALGGSDPGFGLDPSFGRSGVVTTYADAESAPPFAGPVVLPDGSIVVTSEYSIRLVKVSRGGRILARRRPFRFLEAEGMYLRSDGLVLLAGTSFRDAPGAESADDSFPLAVGAVTPGLRASPRFGSQGLAVFGEGPAGKSAEGNAVIELDGRAVAVGGAADSGGLRRPIVARLDARGRPDPGFGSGGVVLTEVPGARESTYRAYPVTAIHALAAQADGGLLAAGIAVSAADKRPLGFVARYLRDGRLDPAFANGRGILTTRFRSRDAAVKSVALQRIGSEQRILLAGSAGRPGTFTVARLHPDGSSDRTFGHDGVVRVAFGVLNPGFGTNGGEVNSILVTQGGRIVLAGEARLESAAIGLVRLTRDGRLDRTFGAAGRSCTPVSDNENFIEAGIVAQPGGRMLVAGLQFTDYDGSDALLARYRSNFALPVACVSVDGHLGPHGEIYGLFARRARLALDVGDLPFCSPSGRPRTVGRVVFAARGPGAHTIRWNGRIAGRRLPRRPRGGCWVGTPVALDAAGREIARYDRAYFTR